MTRDLHEVLNDIASDLQPTDLVAGVATKAARIRWTRRAALGGTAFAVAAVVGFVTIGLPSWEQTTQPDRELPVTQPTIPVLNADIDLDDARTGHLASPSGLAVVRESDGTLRTVALDVERGEAVALEAAAPSDLESVDLSSNGSRALLTGATSAVVVDMATGQTIYELAREKHQPVALSWDSHSLITLARDLTPDPAAAGTPWQLTTIDLATGEIDQRGAPLQRSSAAGEIFPAPFGATIFVRYDGSIQDTRLHRLELSTGATLYSDGFSVLETRSMHWPADGSKIAIETTSALRIMTPTDKVGVLLGSLRKIGVPLGFAGNEHLVWWGGVGDAHLDDLVGPRGAVDRFQGVADRAGQRAHVELRRGAFPDADLDFGGRGRDHDRTADDLVDPDVSMGGLGLDASVRPLDMEVAVHPRRRRFPVTSPIRASPWSFPMSAAPSISSTRTPPEPLTTLALPTTRATLISPRDVVSRSGPVSCSLMSLCVASNRHAPRRPSPRSDTQAEPPRTWEPSGSSITTSTEPARRDMLGQGSCCAGALICNVPCA